MHVKRATTSTSERVRRGAHAGAFAVLGAVLGYAASLPQPTAYRLFLSTLIAAHLSVVLEVWTGYGKKLARILGACALGAIGFHLALPADCRGVEVLSLPRTPDRAWTNRLIPESVGVLLAEPLLTWAGRITPTESKGFSAALKSEYERLRVSAGAFPPSPLVNTLIRGQTPTASDVIVIRSSLAQKNSLVMLHGSGGNWLLLCWLVADAVKEEVALTVCPSVGVLADWDSEAGRRTVAQAVEYLREFGLGKPILMGLSAGGIGAAQLASSMRESFRGVGMLFGTAQTGAQSGLQELYLYGVHDERIPASFIERGARAAPTNSNVTLLPLETTHFGLVTARAEVQAHIRQWVAKLPSE